ncbi:hypothetical protein HMPREF1508_0901 [Shuttleworthella sp. MSX8B]|nr:hypothetical protein HMPREF1508_0901 [Shuttleworthia sp. MSX8B]
MRQDERSRSDLIRIFEKQNNLKERFGLAEICMTVKTCRK